MTIRSAIAWLSLVPWTVAHPAPPVAKADAGPRYEVLVSGGTVSEVCRAATGCVLVGTAELRPSCSELILSPEATAS